MEYVQLGNSDLKVSKICFGCMSFGERSDFWKWQLNQEQTDELIKKALDLGINFFDMLIYMALVQAKHSSVILSKNL